MPLRKMSAPPGTVRSRPPASFTEFNGDMRCPSNRRSSSSRALGVGRGRGDSPISTAVVLTHGVQCQGNLGHRDVADKLTGTNAARQQHTRPAQRVMQRPRRNIGDHGRSSPSRRPSLSTRINSSGGSILRCAEIVADNRALSAAASPCRTRALVGELSEGGGERRIGARVRLPQLQVDRPAQDHPTGVVLEFPGHVGSAAGFSAVNSSASCSSPSSSSLPSPPAISRDGSEDRRLRSSNASLGAQPLMRSDSRRQRRQPRTGRQPTARRSRTASSAPATTAPRAGTRLRRNRPGREPLRRPQR